MNRNVLWFAAGIAIAAAGGRLVLGGASAGSAAGVSAVPAAASIAPSREPGIVRLADPQQAAKIELVVAAAAALPTAPPMPARLAWDEETTARLTVPVDGRVVRLLHQVGDRVHAGEALMEVDSPELATAVADAAKAGAEARLRASELARASELHAAEVIARKDLEAARTSSAQAGAELARAEARVRMLQAHGRAGDLLRLVSPIDGVVAERRATVGQQVRADAEPQFVVTDPRRLALVVDVPEDRVDAFRVGGRVAFMPDIARAPADGAGTDAGAAAASPFEATVQRISPQVDPLTRRVQVRALLPNPDGRLRAEMFVRAWPLGPATDVAKSAVTGSGAAAPAGGAAGKVARADVAAADAVSAAASPDASTVRVPVGSLLTVGARTVVFVERSPGIFEQRPVKVAVQAPDGAWLSGGVRAGERVVGGGALLLQSELSGV